MSDIQLNDRVKVLVNRSEEQPRWDVLHCGNVIGLGDKFVKVFNLKKDSGDVTPDTAEWFPIHAKRIMVIKD